MALFLSGNVQFFRLESGKQVLNCAFTSTTVLGVMYRSQGCLRGNVQGGFLGGSPQGEFPGENLRGGCPWGECAWPRSGSAGLFNWLWWWWRDGPPIGGTAPTYLMRA
jgi:hypothetical protein